MTGIQSCRSAVSEFGGPVMIVELSIGSAHSSTVLRPFIAKREPLHVKELSVVGTSSPFATARMTAAFEANADVERRRRTGSPARWTDKRALRLPCKRIHLAIWSQKVARRDSAQHDCDMAGG
jgi:hypothetical protein